MEEKAIEILKILEDKNFEAYIVGGYVRDNLIGRKTNDIDICTSATPKDILNIFENVSVSETKYGGVIVAYKGQKFDITTFRKEIKYENNRHPVKIKYITDLKKDLLRRDFTINTLCMNSSSKVIDLLEVKEDLNNKILKTVGNPRYRIKEDSLRILRCIRFATILDFDIEEKTKYYLTKYSSLLKTLSAERKKEELDKIFLSQNKEKGVKLLKELKLTEVLNLPNLENIVLCDDLIGIWSQLNVDNIYPFTKVEKEQMHKLRELLEYDDIDNYILYKYGLYLCTVYSDIKGTSKKDLYERYNNLKITSSKDIVVNGKNIAEILNKKPDKYIKDITKDLEKNIINNKIDNNYEEIKKYILDNYKDVED